MDSQITIAKDIQSGEPVFSGTRVPVKNLFDYLKGGENSDDFLTDFPLVGLDQVLHVIALSAN